MFWENSKIANGIFAAPRRGNVRDVLIIALPMLLSMSFDTFMTFADRLFLAKLAPEYMNAALAGGAAQMVIMTFFNGVISYVTALVAQNFGAKRFENCASVASQGIILSLICAPLVFLLAPLGYFMFSATGVEGLQLQAQTTYFNILICGAVIVLLRQAFISFFSGIGQTKIVMIAAFVGMVVNVAANYFLIFGVGPFPALDIRGAAVGTILGNFVTILVLAIKFFGKKLQAEFPFHLKFCKELFLELLKKGAASGTELFFTMLAFQTLILTFQRMGPEAATAASVMFNWDMVAYVPLIGLEVAATSLVGRYVGARDSAAVRRSIRSTLVVGFGYSLVVAFFLIGIPNVLTDIFAPDVSSGLFESARPVAENMLRIASLYVLFEVGICVFAGALRGAGDVFWVMVTLIILNWLSVFALWIGAFVFKISTIASWWIVVVCYVIFPGILYLRYRSGSWRKLMKRFK